MAEKRGLKDGDLIKPGYRFLTLNVRGENGAAPDLDKEARTLRLSFSSEMPVQMWFGREILSHAKGAADLSRLNNGAPLLFNHNRDDVPGVVESAEIGADKRGHALVRFAKTARGDEIMGMVADDILRNISFMYQGADYVPVLGDGDDIDNPTYKANRWEAFEISIVTIPADPTVGIGRAAADEGSGVRVKLPPPAQTTASAGLSGEQEMKLRNHVLQNAVAEAGGGGGGSAAVITQADVQRSADDARKAERERIAAIEEVGKKYKLKDDVVRGMIEKGATIEQARGTAADEILARGSAASPVATLSDGVVDLTEAEKGKYSMLRALTACMDKDWTHAGFERECSNEIAKRTGRRSAGGFFMPMNIPFARRLGPAERAAYSTTAAATGGVLVGTNLLAGSFIEMLRNKARVLQMGATMLSGLVGNVDLPRRSGAGTAYWVADGKAPTESESTFEFLTLNPRTIGAYSIVTRNMLMQSTPDIEMLARADMLAIIALGIDAAALYGTGAAGQPLGIANTTGIGSVVGGTNGAAVTIDNLIDLETQVLAANAPEDSLAYMCNAKTVGALKKLKSTTGQYLWTGSAVGAQSGTPGEINGYPVARTNQVRSNLTKGSAAGICSEIYYGNWSELVIGEWGVLEVMPNALGAQYTAGGIELRALQSIDIGPRHAVSFATMSDALTS